MNISAPFIARPVATTLIAVACVVAGIFAYLRLPIAPLPNVDFPTIQVQAQDPGASPSTVASTVAAPLERHLGAIADVTEITSQSTLGQTRITMQFGLDRNINGAARDVEAAIQAARADLPTSLRSNPSYFKFNPAGSPVMLLALTSKTKTTAQLYDSAQNVISQRLSQIKGIGYAEIGGSALPAVRVELTPQPLFQQGISLETVRAALSSANADTPKGVIDTPTTRYQLYTNDIANTADDYKPLIIGYIKGEPVKLANVAHIYDGTEDLRNAGLFDGQQAVIMILFPTPGANIVKTIDQVRAVLPYFRAELPADEVLTVAGDRSIAIRASLADTQRTLIIAVVLVTLVTLLFLRSVRATIIPAVVVPASIVATFAAMSLFGYSLDNLSLMALTVATGFVVDDAIVVLENIARYMEMGHGRLSAALLGAREVGFTVLSITVSLIAVFLPILLMQGIVGRLFREFAVTLATTIVISMFLSLTLTPMMCARFLSPPAHADENGRPNIVFRIAEATLDAMLRGYERSLDWSLRHPRLLIASFFGTIGLTVWLFGVVPKGFFPDQDTGLILGQVQADQSISFQNMRRKMLAFQTIIRHDPAIAGIVGFTGGRSTNSGFLFAQLKPLADRSPIDQVLARLRPKLARVPGAQAFLHGADDVRAGGHQTNGAYQYVLQSDDSELLQAWTPRLVAALQKRHELVDVNSDQQDHGRELDVAIDRDTTARLNLTPAAVDDTLYDAFGQRLVSTIYTPLAQYHVVMEVAPRYWQNPSTLRQIWVNTAPVTVPGVSSTSTITTGTAAAATASASSTANSSASSSQSASEAGSAAEQAASINSIASSGNNGTSAASASSSVATASSAVVPLSAVAGFVPGSTAVSVNHESEFVATTISFDLPPGGTLGQAAAAISDTALTLHLPSEITGDFAGTAQQFQQSVSDEPILIFAALAAVYVTLGILYESYIHPLTILSTLPSAGLGALLALLLSGHQLDIIGLIGIILLIGIVKKNAILLVDFAITAERRDDLSPFDAIRTACLLRFRPIMMTSFAAAFGALPLAFGSGEGASLRQPLGIAIVGGLVVSQALTLYTTPVVYLALDSMRHRFNARRRRRSPKATPPPGGSPSAPSAAPAAPQTS